MAARPTHRNSYGPITAQPTPRVDRLEADSERRSRRDDLDRVPLDEAIKRLFR